jgi:hypothetical protein
VGGVPAAVRYPPAPAATAPPLLPVTSWSRSPGNLRSTTRTLACDAGAWINNARSGSGRQGQAPAERVGHRPRRVAAAQTVLRLQGASH